MNARSSFASVLAVAFVIALVSVNAQSIEAQRFEIRNVPAELYVLVSTHLFNEGDLVNAQGVLEQGARETANKEVHHNLGVVYYETGDVDAAREQFERALELDQNYALALNSLALLSFEQADYAQAQALFTQLLELEPESAQAHFDLGVSIANQVRAGELGASNLREALAHFKSAERLEPGYPHAVQNIDALEQILEQYDALRRSP